jgi:hypothetical protein
MEAIVSVVIRVVLSLIMRLVAGERRPKAPSRVTTSQARREHEALISTPPQRESQTPTVVIRDYLSFASRRSGQTSSSDDRSDQTVL